MWKEMMKGLWLEAAAQKIKSWSQNPTLPTSNLLEAIRTHRSFRRAMALYSYNVAPWQLEAEAVTALTMMNIGRALATRLATEEVIEKNKKKRIVLAKDMKDVEKWRNN